MSVVDIGKKRNSGIDGYHEKDTNNAEMLSVQVPYPAMKMIILSLLSRLGVMCRVLVDEKEGEYD